MRPAYVPRTLVRSAALLVLAAACSRGDAKTEKDSGDSAAPPAASPTTVAFTAAQVQHGGVRWERAVGGTSATTVTVPGQIVANEDRTARLGAPARGRVLAVRASPGDRVTRGQLLVTLESPEAGMAQSDLAKAEAELSARRAQAQYAASARARAERLLALKSIPRQDYERAVADDEAARSALTQAEAELRRARSTARQLGTGSDASGVIAIRSPLAGVVLTRSAVPGAVVDAGAPLVVVTDPTSLWLQVNAPEKFASLFRRGSPLRFTVPAYPGQSFAARTDAVGAGLDPDTRTLPVRGVLSSDGRLKAEMLATVTVEGAGSAVKAVVLPDSAVQSLEGREVVFLVTPDGKGEARFEARPVTVASRANGRVVITSGLAAGDLVVTAGAYAVKAQIDKASMPEMEM